MPFRIIKIQPLNSSDQKWTDYSTMKTLTCKNHNEVRYITKNPWTRSLFVLQGPECSCPFADLVEVIEVEKS